MNTKLCAMVAGLIVVGIAGNSAAQGTVIQCPAKSIETSVTSSLPDGWWSTPQGGELSATEVMQMGSRTTLVCTYKTAEGLARIRRDAPPGMDCKSAGTGFRCLAAGATGSGGSGSSLPVEGQARADVPVRKQEGKSLTPGNVVDRSGPAVRSAGTCPDLALNGVEVRMLSRDPQGQYFFRLVATLENLGRTDFASSAGQQRVDIYEVTTGGGARRLGSFDFDSVPAGSDRVEATYDVLRWRTSTEFPPAYRFNIVYGPDIGADGNNANDDCTTSNNSTTITGEEINSIIRGSGI